MGTAGSIEPSSRLDFGTALEGRSTRTVSLQRTRQANNKFEATTHPASSRLPWLIIDLSLSLNICCHKKEGREETDVRKSNANTPSQARGAGRHFAGMLIDGICSPRSDAHKSTPGEVYDQKREARAPEMTGMKHTLPTQTVDTVWAHAESYLTEQRKV